MNKLQILYQALISKKALIHIIQRGFSSGWCPICEKGSFFYKEGKWLRDQFKCIRCYSIPRQRALIHVLEKHFPNYRQLYIHESSPSGAASKKLARECQHYTPTHYFPDLRSGEIKNDFRCENLEQQSFADSSFDLVVTQDVLEHILRPEKAMAEIERTLRPGGAHVFTVPWYYWKGTVIRAVPERDSVRHLKEPDFHKNPIDPQGSLVVTEWGEDLCDFIYKNSGMTTTVIRIFDKHKGIDAQFIEVFISQKTVNPVGKS